MIAPDHIEIGSFMALAGVTGGELRIEDTVPGDLRMIRLVFERLGLRSELDGNDVIVPGSQKLVAQSDVGEFKSKIQDGPWPAFPADLTSIAVALATQAEGSILVHEWMFENRLIFTDKLILMGADIVMCDPHRAIVTGPRRLRGERVESPDIRAGMAMLLAALCAEGRSRDRQHPPDRPRLRADRRAPARAGRADRARGDRARATRKSRETVTMIYPIPSGTRDVLPDETREVRAITDTLRGVFEGSGYGEVYTPALEYETVLARGDMAEAQPAYRVFDETGAALVLRSDMTVPIARVVATRYPTAEPPLRFCYFAHCYRGVRPQRGQPRELLQAGIELIGAPAPQGTAEALSVLCHALDATGLKDYRVGLGDASLFPALMAGMRIPDELRAPGCWRRSRAGTSSSSDERLAAAGLTGEDAELLLEPAPAPRRPGGTGGGATRRRTRPCGDARGARAARAEVAERMIFDLGLVRSIGYYTGAVFEVYDPALGAPIGGGGRYDDLLGRFGRALPAVGFALGVDRLHIALAGEERGTGAG